MSEVSFLHLSSQNVVARLYRSDGTEVKMVATDGPIGLPPNPVKSHAYVRFKTRAPVVHFTA